MKLLAGQWIFLISISLAPVVAFLSPADQTLEKAAETAKPQIEVFLKYQSHQADYLIFYDLENSTLLLRYRVDRWDYDNDLLRDSLMRGVTYRVKCRNLKKLADGEIPAGVSGSGLPRVNQIRKIRRIRDIYSAEILAINESALRDLRY